MLHSLLWILCNRFYTVIGSQDFKTTFDFSFKRRFLLILIKISVAQDIPNESVTFLVSQELKIRKLWWKMLEIKERKWKWALFSWQMMPTEEYGHFLGIPYFDTLEMTSPMKCPQNENTLKLDYKLKTHTSNSTFNQILTGCLKYFLTSWQWWYAKMVSEGISKIRDWRNHLIQSKCICEIILL